MINYYKVHILVNNAKVSVNIVADNFDLLKHENRVKDTYYDGRRNWRKDKITFVKAEIIKENIGII
jgi:hypothetical protein